MDCVPGDGSDGIASAAAAAPRVRREGGNVAGACAAETGGVACGSGDGSASFWACPVSRCTHNTSADVGHRRSRIRRPAARRCRDPSPQQRRAAPPRPSAGACSHQQSPGLLVACLGGQSDQHTVRKLIDKAICRR